MKRSEALILIANQLDFLNGKFEGMKSAFTDEELRKADVILTTAEEMGMLPPEIDVTTKDGSYSYVDTIWEREDPLPMDVKEFKKKIKDYNGIVTDSED